MTTIHHKTVWTQATYGWSFAFANAYAVERWYEGHSHATAYRLAMSSAYVRGHHKPSDPAPPPERR